MNDGFQHKANFASCLELHSLHVIEKCSNQVLLCDIL